jgi:hypothetical protein
MVPCREICRDNHVPPSWVEAVPPGQLARGMGVTVGTLQPQPAAVPGAIHALIEVGWASPTSAVTITVCGESAAWGSKTVTLAVYVPWLRLAVLRLNCMGMHGLGYKF